MSARRIYALLRAFEKAQDLETMLELCAFTCFSCISSHVCALLCKRRSCCSFEGHPWYFFEHMCRRRLRKPSTTPGRSLFLSGTFDVSHVWFQHTFNVEACPTAEFIDRMCRARFCKPSASLSPHLASECSDSCLACVIRNMVWQGALQ